jgi:hypothetical protein
MDIPMVLFIVLAFFMFFEFFLNIPAINALGGWLNTTVIVIGYWALIYGAINLARVHGNNILKRTKGEWHHSILTLASAVAMFYAMQWNEALYNWIWDNIWYGLQTALMCYVGFFHFSGMFRTYRAINWGGAVMIISSFFGLVVNAPIFLAALQPLGPFANWYNDTPSAGAWLGFHLVTGLGMFALAARQLIGQERSMLGTLISKEE